MAELEAEKSILQARCISLPLPEPIRLHPKLPEVYKKHVEELHLSSNDPLIRDEASESLRELITRIVLKSSASSELEVTLHGDLAAILQLCELAATNKQKPKTKHPGSDEPGCVLSVVAGTRYPLFRNRRRWFRGPPRFDHS